MPSGEPVQSCNSPPTKAILLAFVWFLCLQGHPTPSYGGLPPHMYAAHSSAASALTAQVAAAAAHQQLNRAAGVGSHSQQGGSRQHKPLHKEDFVEVEKSNMVMLVGWW